MRRKERQRVEYHDAMAEHEAVPEDLLEHLLGNRCVRALLEPPVEAAVGENQLAERCSVDAVVCVCARARMCACTCECRKVRGEKASLQSLV